MCQANRIIQKIHQRNNYKQVKPKGESYQLEDAIKNQTGHSDDYNDYYRIIKVHVFKFRYLLN